MKKIKYIFLFLLIINVASGIEIYSNKLNVPINYKTNHTEFITLESNNSINITIPNNMSLVDYSIGGVLNQNNLYYNNVNKINYTLESDLGLVEGSVLKNYIYINNSLEDEFNFIVVPDNKIGNCKSELGHGNSNWLETNYLPANKSLSLFNLVRVFTLSSYYNEEALNGSVTCTFPSYHILVSQGNLGTVIQHNSENITTLFHWENLGMNWFRVAPLEQEITPQDVNSTYNISCNTLEYYYEDGKIEVPLSCNNFEFRNSEPFLITPTIDGNKLIYSIKNNELYNVYDVEFTWKLPNGEIIREEIDKINAGDSVLYQLTADGNSNSTLNILYIADWYEKSTSPIKYNQQDILNFNISNNTARIFSVELTEFRQGNKVVMSNSPDLNQGDLYKGRLFVEDFFGRPFDLEVNPTIMLISPMNTTFIINATKEINTFGGEDVNTYYFQYDTTNLPYFGIYDTVAKLNINNNIIYRNDLWRLTQISNTTSSGNVSMSVSVTDNSVPSIGCKITINNLGNSGNNFEYSLWISNNSNSTLNDSLDSITSNEYISSGSSYENTKVFDISDTGNFYCFGQVDYDSSQLNATTSFQTYKVSSGSGARYLTGSVVNEPEVLESETILQCKLYYFNFEIFNMCWWEAYSFYLIGLIILTIIIYLIFNFNNIFRVKNTIIDIKQLIRNKKYLNKRNKIIQVKR